MGGSWVDCPKGLCNLWAEKLTIVHNCAIYGLISYARRDCAIFRVKGDRKICTILEPSRLPERIAQFVEGFAQPIAGPSPEKQPMRAV